MAVNYRKHKYTPDDEWHFHRGCLNWPETDCVVTAIPPLDELLCRSCITLYNQELEVDVERKIPPLKAPKFYIRF
jgi:hypothetical protein